MPMPRIVNGKPVAELTEHQALVLRRAMPAWKETKGKPLPLVRIAKDAGVSVEEARKVLSELSRLDVPLAVPTDGPENLEYWGVSAAGDDALDLWDEHNPAS